MPGDLGQAGDAAEPDELIRSRLRAARQILIVSHIRPDGDAVGSMLGLGMALIEAGKAVTMALADGVPLIFRHLKGSERVQRSPGDLARYDTVIVVDSSDLARTGGVLGERVPDINIDHHVTNLNFAAINLVLPEQVATAAILAEHLPAWGLGYNKGIAEALLTGIVTDTIGFRTSNVTPAALRLSAVLMEHGANLPELYTRALINKSFEAARYWGFGLEKIQQESVGSSATSGSAATLGSSASSGSAATLGSAADSGRKNGEAKLVWTSLTLEDRKRAEYPGNDDADLVNVLSSIEGDIALIFVEQKNGHTKVSWRSRPGLDVSKIALQFGGGGHPAASGADIQGPLHTVQEEVLSATRVMLKEWAQKQRAGEQG